MKKKTAAAWKEVRLKAGRWSAGMWIKQDYRYRLTVWAWRDRFKTSVMCQCHMTTLTESLNLWAETQKYPDKNHMRMWQDELGSVTPPMLFNARCVKFCFSLNESKKVRLPLSDRVCCEQFVAALNWKFAVFPLNPGGEAGCEVCQQQSD